MVMMMSKNETWMALQFKKVKRKTYYVARNKPLEIRIYKKKKILMEGIAMIWLDSEGERENRVESFFIIFYFLRRRVE